MYEESIKSRGALHWDRDRSYQDYTESLLLLYKKLASCALCQETTNLQIYNETFAAKANFLTQPRFMVVFVKNYDSSSRGSTLIIIQDFTIIWKREILKCVFI
jgi:hypothetical protein